MSASYTAGCGSYPLLYSTIGQALARTADEYPDREAVVFPLQSVRLTWRQLHERATAFATGLVALGLKPGDRVGIWGPNSLEWILAQFATAQAGLILVNINPAFQLSELEYCLNLVGCRSLILADRFKSSDYISMCSSLRGVDESGNAIVGAPNRIPCVESFIVIGEPKSVGFIGFAKVAAAGDASAATSLENIGLSLSPDDPINIQFTSGTTGLPKGATLTHHNILNNGFFAGDRMGLTAQDRLCIPVPLYHCFGMVLGVLAAMTHGSCMIFPAPSFTAQTTLEAVANERCTALHGVPTMFIAVLEHPDFESFDCSSLRTGIMAGSPCPVEIMKQVMSALHMKDITIGYGMTEVSPLSFQTRAQDTLKCRVETVGKVHDFVEAKIVDIEGKIVARGIQGEVLFRGYSVMQGYWGDPERTAEAIDGAGWIRSGDLGSLDNQGYLRITGRAKDMIIRGGENIYPREIEEHLHTHPAIAEAQVFGLPHPVLGEEVCAWVRLKTHVVTPDAIREWCTGQIAHFKIPSRIKVVDAFPMTVTGKIQKFKMREAMMVDAAS